MGRSLTGAALFIGPDAGGRLPGGPEYNKTGKRPAFK